MLKKHEEKKKKKSLFGCSLLPRKNARGASADPTGCFDQSVRSTRLERRLKRTDSEKDFEDLD